MNNKIDKTNRMTVGALTGIALVTAGSLFAGDYENKEEKHGSKAERYESETHTAMTARSIEGIDINLQNGEEVGVIDDFVFSTESGEIEGISIGTGFLGLGGSDHYVGYDKLEMSDIGGQNLTTDLSLDELEKYPRMDQDSLERTSEDNSEIRSGSIVAMDLIGSEVAGEDGASHGEVHDWIVDLQKGEVPYVIVSELKPFATTSRSGYYYFAVSSDLIEGVRDGDLVVSATSEDFATAERIDSDSALSGADEGSVWSFRYDSGMAQANR